MQHSAGTIHIDAAGGHHPFRNSAEYAHEGLRLGARTEDQVDDHVCFGANRGQIPALADDQGGRPVHSRRATVENRHGVAHLAKLAHHMGANEASPANNENLHTNRLLQPSAAAPRAGLPAGRMRGSPPVLRLPRQRCNLATVARKGRSQNERIDRHPIGCNTTPTLRSVTPSVRPPRYAPAAPPPAPGPLPRTPASDGRYPARCAVLKRSTARPTSKAAPARRDSPWRTSSASKGPRLRDTNRDSCGCAADRTAERHWRPRRRHKRPGRPSPR